MTDYAALLAERFPVRRTRAQKEAFRGWLTEELRRLGWEPVSEAAGRVACQNVLAGDPAHAPVLLTAHYDTPSRWLLPDMVLPRNIPLWVLWQLLHFALLLLPALAAYMAVYALTQSARAGLWGLVLCYLALLALSAFGPANRVNRGEDADLAVLLTLLADLPPEERGKTAVLFADGGFLGARGARAWAKAHPQIQFTRLTLALCRTGDGGTLLAASSALARKCTGFGALGSALSAAQGLTAVHCDSRACTLGGEGRAFRCAVLLACCRRKRGIGLWSPGGRTPADTRCDPQNVAEVCRIIKQFLSKLKTAR